MPGRQGVALTAAPLWGRYIAQRLPGALLLGPDEKVGQKVRDAAAAGGLDHAVCHKQSHGDRDVDVALPAVPAVPVQGRAVVLLDDVASSGRTLMAAARGALAELHASGVRHVWSTDAVPHPTNVLSLVPLLAEALG
jgi:ribose-phosphate pyrophosphokinase